MHCGKRDGGQVSRVHQREESAREIALLRRDGELGRAMGSRGRRLRLVPPAADSRLVARRFPVARVLNVAKSE